MKCTRLIAGLAGAASCLTISAPALADVVVGPRFSYYFDNSDLRTSDQTGFDEAAFDRVTELEQLFEQTQQISPTIVLSEPSSSVLADQIAFPMVGGLVNFGDDRDRFTVTALFGSGSGTSRTTSRQSTTGLFIAELTITDFRVGSLVTETDVDRMDIEVSWQRRLNENFALTAGVRYERLDATSAGEEIIEGTNQLVAFALDDPNLLFQDPVMVIYAGEQTSETFTARIGGTAFVPLDANLNVFLSGMAQLGYSPASDLTGQGQLFTRDETLVFDLDETSSAELSIGPDIAVGAQLIIFENLALDVRYRAIVFFPLTGDFDFNDARVNHGVNVGLSLRL